MLKEITNDFYNISNRLKHVDRAYSVFFNTKNKNFEVYEVKKYTKLFLFTIGKKLDCRAVAKAYKTNFRNFKQIFKSIQNTNFKIEEHNRNNLLDFSKDMLKTYLDFLNRKSSTLDFKNANKTRWL